MATLEKRKTFTVFSQKLAGYLMLKGFVLAGSERSVIDSNRNVFHFYDSPELRNTINDYKRFKGAIYF